VVVAEFSRLREDESFGEKVMRERERERERERNFVSVSSISGGAREYIYGL